MTDAPARRGRPCAVCALPSPQRTAVESALASGTPISRIARQAGAPGRDSLRFHIQAGHLPAQLQDAVERVTGLDATTIAARIVDAAQRARETALDAMASSDHTVAIRAGDAEVRALGMLSHMGETSEAEIQLRAAFRDIAAAVYRVARHDPEVAERIAAELDAMSRPLIADDLRDQLQPEFRNEVTA